MSSSTESSAPSSIPPDEGAAGAAEQVPPDAPHRAIPHFLVGPPDEHIAQDGLGEGADNPSWTAADGGAMDQVVPTYTPPSSPTMAAISLEEYERIQVDDEQSYTDGLIGEAALQGRELEPSDLERNEGLPHPSDTRKSHHKHRSRSRSHGGSRHTHRLGRGERHHHHRHTHSHDHPGEGREDRRDRRSSNPEHHTAEWKSAHSSEHVEMQAADVDKHRESYMSEESIDSLDRSLEDVAPAEEQADPSHASRPGRRRQHGQRASRRHKPDLCPHSLISNLFLCWVGGLVTTVCRSQSLLPDQGGPAYPFCLDPSERSSTTGDALKKRWTHERKHHKKYVSYLIVSSAHSHHPTQSRTQQAFPDPGPLEYVWGRLPPGNSGLEYRVDCRHLDQRLLCSEMDHSVPSPAVE
jgi:hypothetical protein